MAVWLKLLLLKAYIDAKLCMIDKQLGYAALIPEQTRTLRKKKAPSHISRLPDRSPLL